MKDAFITTITNIRPHPNADKLELANCNGRWQVVVPKGGYKEGEEVYYICTDAAIEKRRNRRDWAEELGIRKYLGGGGRVKAVELRGEISNGIVLHLSSLHIPESRCRELEAAGRLAEVLGIFHYEPPIPADLQADSDMLPGRLSKPDEENWQSLTQGKLHYGTRALVTKKVDGKAAILYFDPRFAVSDLVREGKLVLEDGADVEDQLGKSSVLADAVENNIAIFVPYVKFCSRNKTLKGCRDNDYTVTLRPHVQALVKLGFRYKEPVAFYGEICGGGIQTHNANLDCYGPARFLLYSFRSPENPDPRVRYGRYGSGRHFTDIVRLLYAEYGHVMPFVPIAVNPESGKEGFIRTVGDMEDAGITDHETLDSLCGFTVTQELLEHYTGLPAELGEGVVLNGENYSYKARSDDYELKM